MKHKTKYVLRFFKNEIHGDSYERECTEDQIFILFSTCTRYLIHEKGKTLFSMTMIYNKSTFIQITKCSYAILVRICGAKNFTKAINQPKTK